MTRQIVTVRKAAEILGVTKRDLQNYQNRKKSFMPQTLPYKGKQNRLFFYEDDIKLMLKNQEFIKLRNRKRKTSPTVAASFNELAFAFLWRNCEH